MRRKALAAIVGAVLCLGLLAGCSTPSDSEISEAGEPDPVVAPGAEGPDPAVVPEGDVAARDDIVEQVDGTVIATPFYTVTVPEEHAEGLEWEYTAEEYGMGPDDQWEDDGALWLGHYLSVSLSGEAPKVTFFIVASRLDGNGSYVAVQGGAALVKVGEVAVGDYTWVVSVCKGWSPDDPGDSSGEVQAAVEEYATWVEVGFDPSRVTDEAVMADFLESYVGQEWATQQARDNWAEQQK